MREELAVGTVAYDRKQILSLGQSTCKRACRFHCSFGRDTVNDGGREVGPLRKGGLDPRLPLTKLNFRREKTLAIAVHPEILHDIERCEQSGDNPGGDYG